jgi:peptidylprolyl isomerase/FKBP-type peptidyl-prolyl cis-trans isomerase FkpA
MRLRTLAAALVFACFPAVACSKAPDEPTSTYKPAQGMPPPPGPTKLEIEDLSAGKGREAKTGDTVHVQYTGTLTSGKKFDSSYDHGGDPFKFTIGKGEVIKGWDQGVPGMKVGGKRKLRIPSDLGYGANGSPPNIPPNAGLVFEIELVSID